MQSESKLLYKVGIDIGSTTVKTVILDKDDRIVFKSYERHLSQTFEALKRNFTYVKNELADKPFKLTFTGSAAMGPASRASFPFEQEVIACTAAVRKLIPDTDTVIELGGEDAKITYLSGATEQRMNGACAGGTGAFIDQMAALLHTDAA